MSEDIRWHQRYENFDKAFGYFHDLDDVGLQRILCA